MYHFNLESVIVAGYRCRDVFKCWTDTAKWCSKLMLQNTDGLEFLVEAPWWNNINWLCWINYVDNTFRPGQQLFVIVPIPRY